MKYLYYIMPVIAGILGGVLITTQITDSDDTGFQLSAQQLIKNGSPIMGDKDAPITILEWGDYQCTYCVRFHSTTLDEIKSEYIETGKVRLVFKDFPLNGEQSLQAAIATHCADEQDAYWAYHDKLYNNWGGERTGWFTEEVLREFAVELSLDERQFNTCLKQEKYKEDILQMQVLASELGINGTPSFLIFTDKHIINIHGSQPFEVFDKSITELLARK
ncbi:MAG: DsbA family protein [Candidatus Nitrosoabyssus spongiisocia]|nr:MAG: DsbA family protein [Nitrosopumilaceae archaeon AB1(1)]